MKIFNYVFLLGFLAIPGLMSAQERYGYGKKTTRHVTKRHPERVTHKEPTTIRHHREVEAREHFTPQRTAIHAQPHSRSLTETAENWLGFGSTHHQPAAAARMSTHGGVHVVHHEGPRGFFEHHKFPTGWTKGWTGAVEKGEWLFGGHNLEWWEKHYPAYYRDVVRPEYGRAGYHDVVRPEYRRARR